MKKIFYLILILSAFVSCTTNHTTTHTNMQVDHIDYLTIDGFCTVSIYNIEYNGHEYLLLDGYESIDIEHSPDCKKCKSRTEYMPTEYLY